HRRLTKLHRWHIQGRKKSLRDSRKCRQRQSLRRPRKWLRCCARLHPSAVNKIASRSDGCFRRYGGRPTGASPHPACLRRLTDILCAWLCVTISAFLRSTPIERWNSYLGVCDEARHLGLYLSTASVGLVVSGAEPGQR